MCYSFTKKKKEILTLLHILKPSDEALEGRELFQLEAFFFMPRVHQTRKTLGNRSLHSCSFVSSQDED